MVRVVVELIPVELEAHLDMQLVHVGDLRHGAVLEVEEDPMQVVVLQMLDVRIPYLERLRILHHEL
jgi:hypothetical protein